MENADIEFAVEKLKRLQDEFRVELLADWGPSSDGSWQNGSWLRAELEKLERTIRLIADAMGGSDRFVQNLNGVTIQKADIGSHGGEALAHRVSLSKKGTFSAWTVAHELAHAWDANQGWQLSVELEKYTGGWTSPIASFIKRLIGRRDSGFWNQENKPGRRGRFPGCNAAGYFYGDKPSGSDWNFNRKEDFAECVAMYVGWERNNDLSDHAKKRIVHYEMSNGEKDGFGVVDNWADYAKYFYPENGDYKKTKRWQFIDELVKGNVKIE